MFGTVSRDPRYGLNMGQIMSNSNRRLASDLKNYPENLKKLKQIERQFYTLITSDAKIDYEYALSLKRMLKEYEEIMERIPRKFQKYDYELYGYDDELCAKAMSKYASQAKCIVIIHQGYDKANADYDSLKDEKEIREIIVKLKRLNEIKKYITIDIYQRQIKSFKYELSDFQALSENFKKYESCVQKLGILKEAKTISEQFRLIKKIEGGLAEIKSDHPVLLGKIDELRKFLDSSKMDMQKELKQELAQALELKEAGKRRLCLYALKEKYQVLEKIPAQKIFFDKIQTQISILDKLVGLVEEERLEFQQEAKLSSSKQITASESHYQAILQKLGELPAAEISIVDAGKIQRLKGRVHESMGRLIEKRGLLASRASNSEPAQLAPLPPEKFVLQ